MKKDDGKRNLFDELVEGMHALREEREGKMNKVIRKLAEQAMESTGVEGLGGQYRELNPEKFAELLILECAPFVGDPGSKAVEKMMKHFGVV